MNPGKKEKNTKSITLRLFASVFIVLLVMNLLAIIGALSLSFASRNSFIREHRYVQQLYVDQLDRELGQAQQRMYQMSRSYTFGQAFSAEVSKEAEGIEAQYEILRQQVELNGELNEWLAQYPLIDGYFLYRPENGILIICGDDSAVVSEISAELEGEERLFSSPDGSWRLTGENSLIAFSASHRDVLYGAWVQTEQLLKEWGLSEEAQNGAYQILPSDTEESSSCVDVASEQCNCLLRCRMSAGTSFLPTGVWILLIVSMVMLLAIPLVWVSLRRLVILPLRELMGAIRHIESGDMEYRIPEKSTSSEFGRLNQQFNRSLDQLSGMRMQVYESQLEKERIYVNYLSQQMQPHFVLNTLNLIFSMEPDEYDLIQSTVACLSDYYRYVAHVKDPMVPVSAELSHVETYFKLQQIRYPEMFFYSIDCPEELKEIMIPPILIQTFAENAVKHSLRVGEVNQVEVLLEKAFVPGADDRLHILIRDHGNGYPPDVLDKIRRFRETGKQEEGLGIGIQNTIERIRLIYQGRGELHLTNAQDGGARIDLYVPLVFPQETGREKNPDPRRFTRDVSPDRGK